MNIHPTAIVDAAAELDESVEVGPYSIIEGDTRIGANCRISSSVRIYSGTTLGQNNQVDHGVVLGCVPQDLSFDAKLKTGLVIGDYNQIREGVNLSRATSPERVTRVGDHNILMCGSHVGHDCSIGDYTVLCPGSAIAGFVSVGNRAFISALVGIHQHCFIGEYAMLAGCAKIVKDVPPYATADGNPATIIGINSVGLRRAEMEAPVRAAIKEAYRIIYRANMNVSQAVAQLKTRSNCDEVEQIIRFFENSDRGVTGHR